MTTSGLSRQDLAKSASGGEPSASERSRHQHAGTGKGVHGWLSPCAIELDVDSPGREHVLHAAAALVSANHPSLDAASVFRALWRREQAASTALGLGVGVPHARIDGLDQPVTVFLRTKYGIEFNAPDGKPVASFIVIIVPSNGDVDAHLELLATVSRMFADNALRNRLANAVTVPQAWGAFSEWIDQLPAEANRV